MRRKQFTVKVGTVFKQAHIPFNNCLPAFYFVCASKERHLRLPNLSHAGDQLRPFLDRSHCDLRIHGYRVRRRAKGLSCLERLAGQIDMLATRLDDPARTLSTAASRILGNLATDGTHD